MTSSKLELIITKDGSHSIFNPELNETYHSVGGAIQESEFIYVDHGLKFMLPKQELKILEIGFGTGLNAILTLREAVEGKLNVNYTTLEPFPISYDIVEKLNYPDLLNNPFLKEKFYLFHSSPWGEETSIVERFDFLKKNQRIEEFESEGKFDLVFYDAFAPSKQADIWKIDNLRKVKALMNAGGVLITYCSNGQFKRNLKEVGFEIESLPGPLGKREITRASVKKL